MDCIFCKIIHKEAKAYQIYENDAVIAFLDINPASKRHILVVPKTHYADIFDIPKETYVRIQETVHDVVQKLKKNGLEAVNIINSSGEAAGQDVFHIHIHIIPRAKEDSIDFTYKLDTKAQETLQETADKLRKMLN